MGSVKKNLSLATLPERERHHSRLFIDLAENIHIHHREFRTVFSLDEYFEYADIITRSTEDVRNFLAQNPNYQEQKYPTTIFIAGGKERQLKFLENSPSPNMSKYFSNDFAIELQDEFVTDEIHIHYRDFRLALNRKHFKQIAACFENALQQLENFEMENTYEREGHSDRFISDFNKTGFPGGCKLGGVQPVKLSEIKSAWYQDILKEWKPDPSAIKNLVCSYKENKSFFPIVLSTEKDGSHKIIDGHHRFFAASQLKLESIDAIIINLEFSKTENVRKAEALLKEFDDETKYEYNLSQFYKHYSAFSLNRHYYNVYNRLMIRNTKIYRILRRLKRIFFGKKVIFKSFNEAHNG